MERTPFAGLTALDLLEPLSTDGGSFLSRNPLIIDLLLRVGAVAHRHDGHAAMDDPIDPPTVDTLDVGGTIESDTAIYVVYTVLDADGGESLPAPLEVVTTRAGLVTPDASPDLTLDSSSGTLLAGNYYYAVTVTDGAGGETPLGPPAAITIPPGPAGNHVTIDGLQALADGRRRHRLAAVADDRRRRLAAHRGRRQRPGRRRRHPLPGLHRHPADDHDPHERHEQAAGHRPRHPPGRGAADPPLRLSGRQLRVPGHPGHLPCRGRRSGQGIRLPGAAGRRAARGVALAAWRQPDQPRDRHPRQPVEDPGRGRRGAPRGRQHQRRPARNARRPHPAHLDRRRVGAVRRRRRWRWQRAHHPGRERPGAPGALGAVLPGRGRRRHRRRRQRPHRRDRRRRRWR